MQDSRSENPPKSSSSSGAAKHVAWIVALVVGIAIGVVGDRTIGTKIGPQPKPPPPAPTAQRPRPRPPTEDPRAVYKVPVDGSPVKGPADALVTIIESSDFQCPFCKRVIPTLQQIEKEYKGKVRFAFKQNPLVAIHQSAMMAAQASEEARVQGGDAKFWAMHDKLFAMPALDRANIEKAAQELGLDMKAFRKALDGNTHEARIQRDQALVTGLGAGGTPAFFINGRKVTGARPFESFKAVIDEELGKAEAMVKAGTPAAQVYESIVGKGATARVLLPGSDQPQPQEAPPPAMVKEVPFRPDDPAKGPKNAKVTLVLFSDFQCPFCSRIEPTLRQVEDAYKDSVKIVWKHQPLPMHPNAMPAAEASEAAREQGKFWEMHKLMFDNQRELSPAKYEEWAKQIGLNLGKFKQSIEGHKNQARIQEDSQLGNSVGANGTPTFFVNCVQGVGAQPFEMIKQLIDQEIKKAEELAKQGNAIDDQFYKKACAENVKNPKR